jgi:hypothetical protein
MLITRKRPLIFGILIAVSLACLSGCRALLSPEVTKIVETPPAPSGETIRPEELATAVQGFIDMSDITLTSNGKTVTVNYGSRFFVFLDDDKYPVRQLHCEPDWVMGYISNGSFRGPDRYPVYYEATRVGECLLRNGDFSVRIVVVEPTSRSPSFTPLPTYSSTNP